MPIIKNQWSRVVAISQFIPILPLGIMFFLSACGPIKVPHPTHNSQRPQNYGNYQNNTGQYYSNTAHPQQGSSSKQNNYNNTARPQQGSSSRQNNYNNTAHPQRSSSSRQNNYNNTAHPQRGSEDLVLLCECGVNRFVMGKGNSRRTAEQSAQGKCSWFSSSNSIRNCERAD